ncbi:MAG: hypothetical protein WBW41_03385 [Verrucomicrobiia bacterium]
MGRTYHFDCPYCHYQARVSGGADTGLNCAVQTIVCLDCRQLFDVFTRLRQREGDEKPPSAEVKTKPRRGLLSNVVLIPPLRLMENVWSVFSPGRRSSAPPRQWRWENVKPVCPVAGFHRIKIWNAPGRCPRCGNYLEKNGFPFRLWD